LFTHGVASLLLLPAIIPVASLLHMLKSLKYDEPGKSREESVAWWNESAVRACRPRPFQPLSQTKYRNHFMSTATTTEPQTSPHTTTQPTTNPTTQTNPNAAQRLRTTMAAVKLAFTWLGVRKTLAPEQRTTAARAFHADRELLSAG
jgi:hypothetical protein